MLTTLSNISAGLFDTCIFGTGPAGMITALELERSNPRYRILLVEFGPLRHANHRNHLDDSIVVQDPRNHHPPYECTNKGLGGSSATWGGRCVMYDPIDFVPRSPFAQHCTWPQGILDELGRHTDDAAEYFECTPGPFNLHGLSPEIQYRPIAEGFVEGPVTDSAIEKWSRPTRFAERFRPHLLRSAAISLIVNAELRSLGEPDQTGAISSVLVYDRVAGREYPVAARHFVLAMGAQETTRVLLKSPHLFARRGGIPPALGKFYQGHLSGKIATIVFSGDSRKTEYGFDRTRRGEYVRRRFQLSRGALEEAELLNTAFWLDNPLYFDPKHRNGSMSLMYLAMLIPGLGRRLAPPAVARSITHGKVYSIREHLSNVFVDLPQSLLVPAAIFARRYLVSRKLPGVFLYNRTNRYALHFHAEQVPCEANRMELAPDRTSLIIHYSYTDYDVDSVIRAHRVLDHWLRECGCGSLEYWYQPTELRDRIRDGSRDGVHQVGTTRLSVRSDDGVVDPDLLLWGTKNVFVCSSSVFPTSGQANPTFLLGAFAVRLARYLTSYEIH